MNLTEKRDHLHFLKLIKYKYTGTASNLNRIKGVVKPCRPHTPIALILKRKIRTNELRSLKWKLAH